MLLSNPTHSGPRKCLIQHESRTGRKFLYRTLYIANGQNWSNYCEKLLEAAAAQDLLGLLNGTKTKPNKPWNPWCTAAWMRDNTEAQYMVIMTTPPSIHDHFRLSTTACDFFKTLQDLFEKKSTAMTTVHEAWHNNTTCVQGQGHSGPRPPHNNNQRKHTERIMRPPRQGHRDDGPR